MTQGAVSQEQVVFSEFGRIITNKIRTKAKRVVRARSRAVLFDILRIKFAIRSLQPTLFAT
jgi:hypothetical protein